MSWLELSAAVLGLWLSSIPAASQAAEGTFRLLSFQAGADLRLGATRGDGEADVVDVHHTIAYLLRNAPAEVRGLAYVPPDMRSLIDAGSESIAAVKKVHDAVAGLKRSGGFIEPGGDSRVFHPPTSTRIHPPIPSPSKMFGLAGNYPREERLASPRYPSAFFKSVAALVGQDDVIDLAGLVTTGVHEPELAFVIGKKAKNVRAADWREYVVGYTIQNDVSARDLPSGEHPTQGATFSKGLDTFAPTGPYLTLAEDVPDPHNLAIEARLNGEVWDLPNANTKHLTFKIPELIEFLSARVTLLPGDVIATGVPAPVVPLRAGDTVEITVERLGTLRNRVVAKADSRTTQ